jgi:hypothetical protein
MSLKLVKGICLQLSDFNSSGTIQPALSSFSVNQVAQAGGLSGEAKWRRCASSKGCSPFKLFYYSNTPGGGRNVGKRVPRVLAPENSYPSVVGFLANAYQGHWDFHGAGVFLNPTTVLGLASCIYKSSPDYLWQHRRLVYGGNSRAKFMDPESIICNQSVDPKYDSVTQQNNFMLLHLQRPVKFSDKVNNITLARKDQNFTGPCRYASWGRATVLDGLRFYPDKLYEASLSFRPNEDCQKAGFSPTHFCTDPVLCGMLDCGGPVICTENGQDYLYGMGSHYVRDQPLDEPLECGGNVLSAFTSISSLDLDWVNSKIEAAKDCPKPVG